VAREDLACAAPPQRTAAAAEFPGMEPAYPVPPPASITMHPRSARRAELAERVRQEATSRGKDAND